MSSLFKSLMKDPRAQKEMEEAVPPSAAAAQKQYEQEYAAMLGPQQASSAVNMTSGAANAWTTINTIQPSSIQASPVYTLNTGASISPLSLPSPFPVQIVAAPNRNRVEVFASGNMKADYDHANQTYVMRHELSPEAALKLARELLAAYSKLQD